MGIFDFLSEKKLSKDGFRAGAIGYGSDKKGGGHDHRTNKGDDRTPAQKDGDRKRRGPRG